MTCNMHAGSFRMSGTAGCAGGGVLLQMAKAAGCCSLSLRCSTSTGMTGMAAAAKAAADQRDDGEGDL
jgi:hypothetical protein